MKHLLFTLPGIFLGVVALAAQAGTTALVADGKLATVERQLPEFDLQGIDGRQWNAQSLEDKVWVVNFWATWCPPCIEEMPSLNRAWEKLQAHDVGMLAINVGEPAAAVSAFLEKVPVDFPVVLGDPVNTLPNWSARALPTTVVVNANGQIMYEALGPREWDDDAIIDAVKALAIESRQQ